jgi:Uma2 family endonuclease
MTTATKLSIEEYLTYDDGTDTRYEFDDGELVAMPPAIRLHRQIAKFLEKSFEREIERLQQSREVGRGDVGVRTRRKGRSIVRLPDVVVFEGSTAQDSKSVDILEAPPLLVVEIVSTGSTNRKRDYELKRQEYQEIEIPEYWLVDPEKQKVTILKFDPTAKFYEQQEYRGKDTVESSLYPDLCLTAEKILLLAR